MENNHEWGAQTRGSGAHMKRGDHGQNQKQEIFIDLSCELREKEIKYQRKFKMIRKHKVPPQADLQQYTVANVEYLPARGGLGVTPLSLVC